MKKKFMVLPLAAIAVLGLGSCGQEAETEKTKINIWATAAEEEVIKAVVDEYNANHELDFEYEFTAISEADAGTTLANDPTVNGAPALFLCADDHIDTLKSKNIVAEIKNARKEAVINSTTETAVLGATLEDKLWGYPVTGDNGYFLWYNKAALTAEDVTSLETILQKAKAAGKTFLMDVANGWYANSFIMSPQANGVESLKWKKGETGNVYDTTWDNASAVKVSEYVQSLLTPAYTDGTLQMGSNDVIAAGFKDGTMIAAVSGTWMQNDLQAAIGDNLAATKLPAYHIDGTAYQMASFSGSKVYCINKTRPAAEQKTAAELAELLTSKEGQLKRFEIRNALPCNKEAIADARYTSKVTIGGAALVEQSLYACIQAQTAESRYWDIGKAIGQAYVDGNLGTTDAGAAKTWQQFLTDQMNILRNPQI